MPSEPASHEKKADIPSGFGNLPELVSSLSASHDPVRWSVWKQVGLLAAMGGLWALATQCFPKELLASSFVGGVFVGGVMFCLLRILNSAIRRPDRLEGTSIGRTFDIQATAMRLELPLLSEVDKGFSDVWWANYRALVAKREDGSIAPDEMRELVALTDTLEEVNVRRMACFASASRLLGMSLDELMQKANLKPKVA